MIESLTSILSQSLGYIIPMIVLLGLLIFVHEMGHFLAAKFFKVRVETFSLGFGPKILRWVYGETTYCISALPLGGYVKMFGDEPGREIPISEQQDSYLHKPVGQRIVIVLAGPIMNLLFAAILFFALTKVGDKALSPVVGEIATNSPAFHSGFKPYDQILSINSDPIETWDQVQKIIELNPEKELSFKIQRLGEEQTLLVQPENSKNDNLFSTADSIGKIKGLHSNLHLPILGVRHGSFAESLGLKSGDRLISIDGESIEWFKDIEPFILEVFSSGLPQATLKIRRYSDIRDQKNFKEFDVIIHGVDLKDQPLGIFIPQTVIAEVQKDSPAEKTGLIKGDQILAVGGQQILSFEDIVRNVSAYDPNGEPLQITILRDGETKDIAIVPQMNSLEGQFGETENRFTIGVVPSLFAIPQSFLWKSKDFSSSLQRSFEQTYNWTRITLLSFVRILQNRVSSKNISGIISIGQVAQQSWNIGLNAFLKMMAIISINLFVLNLLPIPILDGGHLVLFTLEAIKGAPISLKKVEMAQQVGFLIILFLMAFALFNDFSRIFGS